MQDAERAVTEQRIDRIESRVQTLEEFRNESEKTAIRAEEQQKSINNSINRVVSRLDKIDNNVGKVLWIIAGALLMSLIAWVLDGNLGKS